MTKEGNQRLERSDHSSRFLISACRARYSLSLSARLVPRRRRNCQHSHKAWPFHSLAPLRQTVKSNPQTRRLHWHGARHQRQIKPLRRRAKLRSQNQMFLKLELLCSSRERGFRQRRSRLSNGLRPSKAVRRCCLSNRSVN